MQRSRGRRESDIVRKLKAIWLSQLEMFSLEAWAGLEAKELDFIMK